MSNYIEVSRGVTINDDPQYQDALSRLSNALDDKIHRRPWNVPYSSRAILFVGLPFYTVHLKPEYSHYRERALILGKSYSAFDLRPLQFENEKYLSTTIIQTFGVEDITEILTLGKLHRPVTTELPANPFYLKYEIMQLNPIGFIEQDPRVYEIVTNNFPIGKTLSQPETIEEFIKLVNSWKHLDMRIQ